MEKSFTSPKEFEAWLKKNHQNEEPLWVVFQKRSVSREGMSAIQAAEVALCYGWSGVVMKAIDFFSFKIRFSRRKKNSAWGPTALKQYKVLEKAGRMKPSGREAYKNRNVKKSIVKFVDEFPPKIKKEFQSHKTAWEFFKQQTNGYQKYMIHWVTSAKREETFRKRLDELIRDSAAQTKLRRVVEAEKKFKPKYPEGATPIEAGKNLGIASGAELRSVGIETLEQLKRIGWEKAFLRWTEMYPNRINKNALKALIGAVEEQNSRKLDPDLAAEGQVLLAQIQRGLR